jgi:hypothetical protein
MPVALSVSGQPFGLRSGSRYHNDRVACRPARTWSADLPGSIRHSVVCERLRAMHAADWIALYAAIVGTAAFSWQSFTYVSERRPKLRVEIMLMHYILTMEEAVALQNVTKVTGRWRIQIEILNLGRSPVRISQVSVVTNHDPSGFDSWQSGSWNLPWLLDTGDEKMIFLTSDEVGDLNIGQQIHARVTTTTGKEFLSETLGVGTKNSHEVVVMPQKHLSEVLAHIPEAKRPKFWGPRIHAFDSSPSGLIPDEWLKEE